MMRVFKLCLMGTILFISSLNFPINVYASDFRRNSEKFAKGFSVAASKSLFGGIDMRGRASNNSPFCAIEKWNSLLRGKYNEVTPSKYVTLYGENLRNYTANTTPVVMKLYRLLAEDLVKDKSINAKYFLNYVVGSEAFTAIKPHKFTRLVVQEMSVSLKNFSQVDEQIAKSSMILLAAAITVEAHKTSLSDKELENIAAWGNVIFDYQSKLDSDLLDLTHFGKVDVRAQVALGYIAFGIATNLQEMFEKGLSLFQRVIDTEIQRDGGLPYFLKGHEGAELSYHNQTIGYLAVAASVLKANGFDMYNLENANGGSLNKAIGFVVGNAFENKSSELSASQLRMMIQTTRTPFENMAWLEFAANDNAKWLEDVSVRKAFDLRNNSASWITENKAGFNGANFGGYTSCYFSSVPPERAEIDEIKMFDFYQNTTFDQRSCLFKNINPDLLVLFKANQDLPTAKLEERRIEEYDRCKDA